jgi:hypothetical protein
MEAGNEIPITSFNVVAVFYIKPEFVPIQHSRTKVYALFQYISFVSININIHNPKHKKDE